jgi:Protein of unknown function (DUF1838)
MTIKLCSLVFACLLTFAAQAQIVPFDNSMYETWIDMRAGDGKKPVYWYCEGEVYSYPDGTLVARMQGVDAANLFRPTADSAVQLNRKIFIYTDKNTGTVLREVNGQPVQHIKYDYQQISYVRSGDKLKSYVVQGKAPRITRMGPGSNTTARKVGKTIYFSSPVFLNFPLPGGKVYEAYENYDFIVNRDAKRTKNKYQLTWVRYGDLPPFLGGQKGVLQLVCHRVDQFEDLPDTLRNYITNEAPLWMKPPQDTKEIELLQQAQKK